MDSNMLGDCCPLIYLRCRAGYSFVSSVDSKLGRYRYERPGSDPGEDRDHPAKYISPWVRHLQIAQAECETTNLHLVAKVDTVLEVILQCSLLVSLQCLQRRQQTPQSPVVGRMKAVACEKTIPARVQAKTIPLHSKVILDRCHLVEVFNDPDDNI